MRASHTETCSCALLVALTTVILNIQQVALTLNPRPNFVEPFDEFVHLSALVREETRSLPEPGLGHVMQLSTYMRAKASSSMSTTFHIYRSGKITRDIQFRAQDPLVSAGDQQQRHLDLGQDYQYNLEMMLDSGFDVNKKTVIMIPGYLSDYEEQWAREAMHAWLHLYGEDINVVVLSWADSNRCIYSQAVATTPLVARQVTVFLHYLAQLGGLDLRDQAFLDRIHLIGHSLGAHICGFVGQDLGGRVGRITGLDPAGPTFDSYPIDQRLDRGDARLVEVLHTNAGRLSYMKALPGLLMHAISSSSASSQFQGDTTAWFGIAENIGHIDYYANNGRTQPGCTGSLHICDHGRAGEIYVDMLRYEKFLRDNGQWSAETRRETRLWAFRANSYEDFQAGTQFHELCPEVVGAKSHLNTTKVARNSKSCSAPLLDFLTPVDELVRELRDEFHINFDKNPEASQVQPRFYFRTKTGVSWPDLLMADQYFLKVYLDRNLTRWDSSECILSANLYMHDGDRYTLELTKLDQSQESLALPFAHSLGTGAHRRMRKLADEMAAGLPARAPTERFTEIFSELFPRTISLSFATLPRSAETTSAAAVCALGVKLIEVHPFNVYMQNNLGAVYGGRPLLPGQDLEFVRANELSERLSSDAHTVLSFGQMNSLGVSLEAAVVS